MSEKLGCMEWWWLGSIYSPQPPHSSWGGCLSMGAPDSPVCQPHHPTVRVLKILTIGALTSCRTGQSGAAPDRFYSLFSVPLTPALTSACTVHALFTLLQTTVALDSRYSAGTPDSPVAHRTVRWIIAERRLRNPKLKSWSRSTLVHRTLSGGTPDSPVRQTRVPFSFFAPFFLNPNFDLLLVCVEPLCTCGIWSRAN
jgi:hypothetical protein